MDLEYFSKNNSRPILPNFFPSSNRFNSMTLSILITYGYSIVKFLFLFQISEKKFHSPMDLKYFFQINLPTHSTRFFSKF